METETRNVERVRVAVRVRPRNTREKALDAPDQPQHVVSVDAAAGQIYVCKKKPDRTAGASGSTNGGSSSDATADRELRCNYDRVFDATATQDNLFDYVRDSVQQIAQGFNCTIFAYGQTGTGKTHTMLGRDLEKSLESAASTSVDSTTRENWGVIPRAVESLFDELQSIARHGAAAAVVHCSYMQIYNNDVYDLLQENKCRMTEPLAVRELIKGNDKQIYVSGLSEFRVTSLDETLKLLHLGNKNRRIRATEYNEKSSRSHALLQLSAEVESRGAEGPTTIIRRAKLSLVDLAGSEKWATDFAMGVERCKELTSINQSLSALGNVISALANPKRTHIPYRDSKLTRLLQDSLGGNTRTTVIATISQDVSAIEETISTLQFADRAKCVTLRVRANEMVDDAVLLAQARRDIARLTLLLKKNTTNEQLNELEQKVAKLTRENASLASENKRLKQTMSAMKKERDRTKTESSVGNSNLASASASESMLVSQTVVRQPEAVSRVVSPRAAHMSSGDQRQSATLRLDLEQRESRVRPVETTDLIVDHREADHARRLREEQNQTQLLEQIQSERRALEQELERIQELQSPRPVKFSGDSADSVNRDSNGTEVDDVCPMCRRLIDEHNDDELDTCIERETVALVRRETANGNSRQITSPSTDTRDLQDQSRVVKTPIHMPPRTPPPTKKPLTPRHSSLKKPPSPYLQDMFAKPQAPPQSSPHSSLESAPQQLAGQRRSVRDLAHARNTDNGSGREQEQEREREREREREDETRPNTADANVKVRLHETHHLTSPIVHQGSKSVKALKKFQASSPYSTSIKAITNKSKATATAGVPPHPFNTSNNTTSDPAAASATDHLTSSLGDIGLSLLVYKFRYDCWYPCTVVGFDAKRRLHCCQYEYGDKQWQDLRQTKSQIVGRSD